MYVKKYVLRQIFSHFLDFGRNHKAKLWSLEIVGELNNYPVKISLPAQVGWMISKGVICFSCNSKNFNRKKEYSLIIILI